jgi:CubicO group peptidase (beta-lactamase class C family)
VVRNKLAVLALATLGAALAAGESTARAEPAAEQVPKTLDALRERLANILAEERVPGLGVALVRREGVVWTGGIGKADLATGREITKDTQFRVGSVTKSFVALAIMRAVEAGRLSLDATVRSAAPEIAFENPWEATRPVRLAHLLEHTAGFDDMHPSELEAPPEVPLRDVLAICPRSRVSRWPPGTRHSYSNPGYTVAGYVLEKTTGRRYEDAVRELVLDPLAMPESTFEVDPALLPKLARGYDDENEPAPSVMLAHRPAGHFVTSATELAHLVEMWLNRGSYGGRRLVSEETVRRMEHPGTLPYPDLPGGYGLGNYTMLSVDLVLHGHEGDIDGFSSEYAYVPELGIGWVLLYNTSALRQARIRVRSAVAGFLMRDLRLPPPPPTIALDAGALARLEGYYAPVSPRVQLNAPIEALLNGVTLTAANGALAMYKLGAPADQLRPLVPTKGHTFRFATYPAPSILFAREPSGSDVVIVGSSTYERRAFWPVAVQRAALLGSLVLGCSALLFAPVWGLRAAIGRRHRNAAALRLLAAAPWLAIAGYGYAVSRLHGSRAIATANAWTVAIFVLPLLLVSSAAIALVAAARDVARRTQRPAARVHTLLVALAGATVAGFFVAWGLVGLRLWSY